VLLKARKLTCFGFMNMSVPFNPHVVALPPYNSGMTITRARELSGREDIARLASNENPDGCSPQVLATLSSLAFEPWRYADPACTALRTALGSKLGVEPNLIVVGNGSEEMIAAISRAVLVPGADVVTVVPSFGLHEIDPLAAGAKVIKIPMTKEAGFDIAALEAAIAAGPRIVFLSSPWNPVGPALDHSELQRLIKAVRPQTLFVLDEAYFEFADPNSPNGLAVLHDSGTSYVVLRTFSKAYGLAGLRVGYAICSNTELARVIASGKTPFNVNAAAQVAAVAALDDEAWMKDSVAKIRNERVRVASALSSSGFAVAPSQTNFVFFDCGADSVSIAGQLLQEGIIVKAWREKGYEQFVRVTIGKPAENSRLIEALKAIKGKVSHVAA
jgi:histidinol-phosphate aminotransferase